MPKQKQKIFGTIEDMLADSIGGKPEDYEPIPPNDPSSADEEKGPSFIWLNENFDIVEPTEAEKAEEEEWRRRSQRNRQRRKRH
jgi:hypothetical protein